MFTLSLMFNESYQVKCSCFLPRLSHKQSAAIISTAGRRQSGVHLISFNDYISVSFAVLFYLRSNCGVTQPSTKKRKMPSLLNNQH